MPQDANRDANKDANPDANIGAAAASSRSYDDRPVTLITGAAGFIGSHLAEHLLAAGQHVVGVDNLNSFYDPALKRANLDAIASSSGGAGFRLAEIDIRDRDAVLNVFREHRPTVVVHLAAMAGVRPSIEDPALYTSVNLAGTVNLLDAAVESRAAANDAAPGVGKFVFASSSSVYGNNKKAPFAEADRVDHPISPYAATKKAGELICHSYHHLNQLAMTCLRFFTVFGPRQRPDLAICKFLKRIAAGETIQMFGDGASSRDYTFVEDIVAGITASIDHCQAYHIYNLGGSSPITLRDMIATIERVVGKKAVIDQLPMQPGDVDRTWADLSHSESELGYKPTTSFEDGVAKQWAWLKAQGFGA